MQTGGWERETSPYHSGEQELHERVGRRQKQEDMGRRIHRPFMLEQHRTFFNQLPFMIVASVDMAGSPWASIVFGKPGFVTTPTDRKMAIAARPLAGDPLAGNLAQGAPLGFLGIELPTRRRNRMNGVATGWDGERLDIDVVQSFGNCPQYIQTRSMNFTRDPQEDHAIVREDFAVLDQATRGLIARSDSLFVASHNHRDDPRDTGGVDVNHRGGRPGFVKVEQIAGRDVLTVPDYVGNFAFNTLGNFLVNPKAGLLFIDFDSGDIIMLTGTVEVLWDTSPEIAAFEGAERAWCFTLERGVRLRDASPLRFTFGKMSPNSQRTGTWEQAAKLLAAGE